MAKNQTRRALSLSRETYERLKVAGVTLDRTLSDYAEQVLNEAMDEDGIGPTPYVRPSGAQPRRFDAGSRVRRRHA